MAWVRSQGNFFFFFFFCGKGVVWRFSSYRSQLTRHLCQGSLAPPHGSHLGTPPSGDTWPCLEAFLVDTAERVLLAPSRWGPGVLQTCWGAQGAPQQRSSPEGQPHAAVGGQRRPGLLRGSWARPSLSEPCRAPRGALQSECPEAGCPPAQVPSAFTATCPVPGTMPGIQ